LFHGKPVIGITGGIGSGKSTVAKMFGDLGCLVVSSDEQVAEAYRDPAVIQELRLWWGDEIVDAQGRPDRRRMAAIVFRDPGQRRRLEALLHPKVAALREKRMKEVADNPQVPAIIWDTPLLFEAGLSTQCDAIVFVEAPLSQRLKRVQEARGWDEAELGHRENSQWPLDKKREISDYTIDNTADAEFVRGQVREVLFRIISNLIPGADLT
jgi:dephospho-CoA kinase